MILSLNVNLKNIFICAKNAGFEVLTAVTLKRTAFRLILLVSYLAFPSNLKIEAICSSETSGCLRVTKCFNSEDCTLNIPSIL
jgi:hypothetical protein